MNRHQAKQAIRWYKAKGQNPYHRIGTPPILFPAYSFEMYFLEIRESLRRSMEAMYDTFRGAAKAMSALADMADRYVG